MAKKEAKRFLPPLDSVDARDCTFFFFGGGGVGDGTLST